MAEIPVEKKRSVPWLAWLIGLLVILAALWFWLGGKSRDPVVATSAPAPAEAPASAVADVPPAAPPMEAASAPMTGPAASAPVLTDPGIYASTSDKAALAGRDVALTGAMVARIVGPKTFTIASGSDELFVVIDQDLSSGVGSQGRIDKGDSVSLKGTFRLLQQGTISDISERRFRELTELERETLAKTQIYLHATEFSRIN